MQGLEKVSGFASIFALNWYSKPGVVATVGFALRFGLVIVEAWQVLSFSRLKFCNI
jgi:hypothetical protein